MDLNADRLGSDAQRPAFFAIMMSQRSCLKETFGINDDFGRIWLTLRHHDNSCRIWRYRV